MIDTLEFEDVREARDTIEKSTKKLEKKLPGLIVSGIATTATLLSFVISNTSVCGLLLTIAFFGSIASYIVGGGFKIALKTAGKLAAFGWFICPFPIDIGVGLFTLIFAIWAFFFFPIVFVALNIRQQKKNIEDAEDYLEFCDQMLSAGYNYGGCYAQTPAYAPAPAYAQAPANAQPVYQTPDYQTAPVALDYQTTPVNNVNRVPSPPPFIK